MKKEQIEVGGVYAAIVSGKLAKVKIESTRDDGWAVCNLYTGRRAHIKTVTCFWHRVYGHQCEWTASQQSTLDIRRAQACVEACKGFTIAQVRDALGKTWGKRKR